MITVRIEAPNGADNKMATRIANEVARQAWDNIKNVRVHPDAFCSKRRDFKKSLLAIQEDAYVNGVDVLIVRVYAQPLEE